MPEYICPMFLILLVDTLARNHHSCLHLLCKLLNSFQPVFNIPDGGFYISSLLFHTSGHLGDAFDSSVAQAFQLKIQNCHIWLAFQNWKLEAGKSNSWKEFLDHNSP